MPTKHIPEKAWRKVEKELVKAVIATQKPIKEASMLETLIEIGIKNATEEDYRKIK